MTFAPGDSFLELDGEWYRPTSHTRGPWDPDACHGGPPAGAIARELELLVPGAPLRRLTLDLLRPVPFAGFRVVPELIHGGRTVSSTAAELVDAEGRVCARARGLHIASSEPTDLPTVEPRHPGGSPAEAPDGPFPIQQALHDLPAFNDPSGVRMRYPVGHDNSPGPTITWMQTVPLLPDEVPSPFQRICALADSGNAISRNAQPEEVNFVNPDLTLVLHRNPVGEWLGSQAESHWQPDGVGRALQTLVLRVPR
jgi:hypothetical protein